MPNLAACLRDKDKLVRKQTLTQLTQLVLVSKDLYTSSFFLLQGEVHPDIKGITKFWYGVMNLVQMNILEAYTILQ